MNPTRKLRIRQLAMDTCTALVLGAGLVLAAQGPGRADPSAGLRGGERYPLWVPGSEIPMAAYIRQDDLSSAPPR